MLSEPAPFKEKQGLCATRVDQVSMLSEPAPFKEKLGLCATRVDQVLLIFGPGRAITLLWMVQRDQFHWGTRSRNALF